VAGPAVVARVVAVEVQGCAAGLAAQRLPTFPDRDDGDAEGDDRVGPRPAERGVEYEPEQHGGGQVGAEQSLLGVRDCAGRSQLAAGAALRPGQERHDHDADRDEHDSHGGVLGLVPADQGAQRLNGDVGSEGEERAGDDPQRNLLPALGVRAGELPGHRGGGADLDHRVESEPDQRHGRGDRSGGDRDDGLDEVVRDRRCDQQADPAPQHGPAIGGQREAAHIATPASSAVLVAPLAGSYAGSP
jgi:hypothetical protein